MTELARKRCVPCEGGVPPLTSEQAQTLLKQLEPRWVLIDNGKKLVAHYDFKNYFRTLAFVNAVAYVAIQEDHHPNVEFGYNAATITYWTHAIGGLSENDFICAARIDALAR